VSKFINFETVQYTTHIWFSVNMMSPIIFLIVKRIIVYICLCNYVCLGRDVSSSQVQILRVYFISAIYMCIVLMFHIDSLNV